MRASPNRGVQLLWIALAATSLTASAQDRRTVIEPVIPEVCQTLTANLTAKNGSLSDADETKVNTAQIQKGLDGCGQGKALRLTAEAGHNAFLTGPFTIPAGVTLLVDRGAVLLASRDPRLYDLRPESCGLVSADQTGCKSLITLKDAPHSGIMGDGSIDGRGGAKLLNGSKSWWDLAADARGGGRQQVFRLLEVNGSDDFTLYRITLRNSPNFHVVYHGGKGFTVWGVAIDTPKTARNTDGIDPSGTEDMTVTKSFIRTGDDNIAIKGSAGGVRYVSVIDNHFYYGHGMSIGSETYDGVSHLLVRDLTLDGTDSGIRIKSNASRGGLVDGARYENVCIRDSKNPIYIDTEYNNPGPRNDRIPDYRNIMLANVQISGGGKITVEGIDAAHRTAITFDGVLLDGSPYKMNAVHAAATYGPGPVNFHLSGEDVSSAGSPGKASLPSCSGKFVPFPQPKD